MPVFVWYHLFLLFTHHSYCCRCCLHICICRIEHPRLNLVKFYMPAGCQLKDISLLSNINTKAEFIDVNITCLPARNLLTTPSIIKGLYTLLRVDSINRVLVHVLTTVILILLSHQRWIPLADSYHHLTCIFTYEKIAWLAGSLLLCWWKWRLLSTMFVLK